MTAVWAAAVLVAVLGTWFNKVRRHETSSEKENWQKKRDFNQTSPPKGDMREQKNSCWGVRLLVGR